MRAGTYVPTPKQIRVRGGVVNVQSNDSMCFAWALTSALVPPRGPVSRPTSYAAGSVLDLNIFDFTGMVFPVKLKDIAKFEALNPVSVNVYGLDTVYENNLPKMQVVGPLYYTKEKKNVHVNLLLISDFDDMNHHYCWIKNFSRLISSQISRHFGAKHFCDGCLIYFDNAQKLLIHRRYDCNKKFTQLPQATLIADKSGKLVPANVLKFQNFQKQLQVPFVIYADFETLLKPIQTSEPDPDKKFTIKTCEHEPHSFAYYIKCSFDESLSQFRNYRGPNASSVFMEFLDNDCRNLYNDHLKTVKPMVDLTAEQNYLYENTPFCHICELPFDGDDLKVRDHCHLTGSFRGAAHAHCNLHYKIVNFVPVFFHNLTGYDSHLFVKELAMNYEKIDVIPLNKEKYISFGKHILVDRIPDVHGRMKNVHLKIRFLDSYRFLPFSLQTLAGYLSDEQCVEVRKYFPEASKFDLIRQKGVFPYSYVDSLAKLTETSLPLYRDFYDTLRGTNISEEDYRRACNVWSKFECKTLGDYSDLYLKSDVLLLADIFQNFRKQSLQNYKLDPCQYFTNPGLSWDAMLKFTSVELELLTDVDMYHFFKGGIRGGVSSCVKRESLANNSFLADHDPAKTDSFILYLDATNLYGHSMTQYLPQNNFTWLTPDRILNFDCLSISDTSDVGYVLEVDIEYPETLHDEHNELPFCPENILPPNGTAKGSKLIPNLLNKVKYVIHYRNLKQSLRYGLRVTKTHRILQFNQSPWLKKYIDFNSDLRSKANNEFEKSNYKLMNNAVFGKTMENVDNRVSVKLISHWARRGHAKGVENYVAQPHFKNVAIFTENLAAVQMETVRVVYDKPVYVGFSILDVSKTVMYDFFYGFLKKKYGDGCSLLYTDTDSLILEIQTKNVYDDIRQNIDLFDTSDYKSDNIHNIPVTKSVVGKMKDEYKGAIVRGFYGVGAKTYCVDVVGKDLVKKAKGVKRPTIDLFLKLHHYRSVVQDKQSVICKMIVFKSELHTIYTELKNKVALAPNDNKRFNIPNTHNTLAWGHRDILWYNDIQNNLRYVEQVVAQLAENETVDVQTNVEYTKQVVGQNVLNSPQLVENDSDIRLGMLTDLLNAELVENQLNIPQLVENDSDIRLGMLVDLLNDEL